MLPSHQNLSTSSSHETIDANQNQALQPASRPLRITKCLTYLSDYHFYLATNSFLNLSGLSSSALLYPISSFLSYHRMSKSCRAFTLVISTQTEPQTFLQAVESQVWRDSMDIELHALERNHTWSLVTFPLGKQPIGCKWYYKIKHKANGTVECYKAHLVAEGYT